MRTSPTTGDTPNSATSPKPCLASCAKPYLAGSTNSRRPSPIISASSIRTIFGSSRDTAIDPNLIVPAAPRDLAPPPKDPMTTPAIAKTMQRTADRSDNRAFKRGIPVVVGFPVDPDHGLHDRVAPVREAFPLGDSVRGHDKALHGRPQS